MDLLISNEHVVLLQRDSGLVCDRSSGQLKAKPRSEVETLLNKSVESGGVQSLGRIQGIVGKLRAFPDAYPRLVLIRNSTCIGELPGTTRSGLIYRIDRIALLPLVDNSIISTADLVAGFSVANSDMAAEHANKAAEWFPFEPALARGLQKTREGLTLVSHGIAQHASSAALNRISAPPTLRERDRLEQRLLVEVEKTFSDSSSFYFCPTDDITSSTQRRYDKRQEQQLRQRQADDNSSSEKRGPSPNGNSSPVPSATTDDKSDSDSTKSGKTRQQRPTSHVWKNADERFFWNMMLLKDLMSQEDELADAWIIPVMQGYVEFATFPASALLNDANHHIRPHHHHSHVAENSSDSPKFIVSLVSRRSRHRAGTRYRRRGVDVHGHVANYVETEQILLYNDFVCSFTLTRGSVPVYWKQMGMRYRPPPELERDEESNAKAFALHMQGELKRFEHCACVSLVEQHGRESVLSEAFLENTLRLNSPDVTFISFDFHDHCRGLRFERVAILVDAIEEILREMKYFWTSVQNRRKDADGKILDAMDDSAESVPLCRQNNVFRVNCIDCLDRTNVVQMSIARNVLEVMLRRLNILAFESSLPRDALLRFQCMWANNGDVRQIFVKNLHAFDYSDYLFRLFDAKVISRQYAGTDALKADFTRTGERNLFGMMKDGYKSVSRYYQKTFKALYRQAAIEISLGKCLIEQEILADVQRESAAAAAAESGAVDDDRSSPTTKNATQPNSTTNAPTTTRDNEYDRVRELLEDGRQMIVPDGEIVLGNWALCDAHNNASDNAAVTMPTSTAAVPGVASAAVTEIDRILILTQSAYFVAEYNEESDEFVRFSYVPLKQVFRVEFGPEIPVEIDGRDSERPLASMEAAEQVVNKVLSNATSAVPTHLITIFYRQMMPTSAASNDDEWIDKYHQFRCPSFRLFNNVVIANHTVEDMRETLKSIAEAMSQAYEHLTLSNEKNGQNRQHLKVLECHVKVLPRDALATAPSTVSATEGTMANSTRSSETAVVDADIVQPVISDESSTTLNSENDAVGSLLSTGGGSFPTNQQHRPSLSGEMTGLQALNAHKTSISPATTPIGGNRHSAEKVRFSDGQSPPLIQHVDLSSKKDESDDKKTTHGELFDETQPIDNRAGSLLQPPGRSSRPPRSNSDHAVLNKAAQQMAESLESGREQGSLGPALSPSSSPSTRPSGLGLSMEKLNAVGGALTKGLAHRMHGVLGNITGHHASTSPSTAAISRNGSRQAADAVGSNNNVTAVAASTAPPSAAAVAEKQRRQKQLEERIKNSKSRIILL